MFILYCCYSYCYYFHMRCFQHFFSVINLSLFFVFVEFTYVVIQIKENRALFIIFIKFYLSSCLDKIDLKCVVYRLSVLVSYVFRGFYHHSNFNAVNFLTYWESYLFVFNHLSLCHSRTIHFFCVFFLCYNCHFSEIYITLHD